MAEEDFNGEWRVHDTSGTPFGIGTLINISKPNNKIEVTFDPPAGDPEQIHARYEGGLEALIITGVLNTGDIYVSRYVDEDNSYYGIYGLALMDGNTRTAVFTAGAMSTPSRGPAEARDVSGSSFEGFYSVGTTSGAQFGKQSTVQIEDEGGSIHIENVTGELIETPESLFFDEAVAALRGSIEDPGKPIVRFQISLGPQEPRKHVYGLSVVGDPEEAGAWEGGDDDPPPGDDTLPDP